MAVDNTSASSGPYVANGVTTIFPFTFIAASASEVRVLVNNVALDQTGYTVTLDDTGAGRVTISPAPVSGSVMIESNPDFTQTTSFQRSGPYFPDFVNKPLDRGAIRDIFLLDKVKRAIIAPLGVEVIPYLRSLVGLAFKGDAGTPGGNIMSIPSFASISSTPVSTGTNRIRTENGTDYVADAAVTPTFAAAHPAWATVSANGRGFRLANGPVDLEAFGAVDDDVTDCFPAWLGYSDLIAYENLNGGSVGSGSRWLRAYGRAYYFSDTLQFTRTTRFSGAGTGVAGAASTILRFPANKAGIVVNAYNTLGEGLRSVPGTGADGSIIEGFSIRGGGGTSNELKSGVWFRARGKLRDCTIRGFAGHGWLVRASEASSDPTLKGNANGVVVDTVRSEVNLMSGARTFGEDSNGCWFRAVDFGNNGRYGFEEDSFLGSNEWSFQSEGNTLGAFECSGATNQSTIIGYTEPQPPAKATGASIIYGAMYAGFTADSTCPYISGDSALDGGGISSSTGWYVRRKRPSDNFSLKTIIGSLGNFFSVQMFNPVGLNFEEHALTGDNQADLYWRIANFYTAFGITNRKKYGRPATVDNAFVVTNLFVGPADNARQLAMGVSTIPTTGQYAEGDFVMASGQAIVTDKLLLGWKRMTSGSAHVLGTDWAACYVTTA